MLAFQWLINGKQMEKYSFIKMEGLGNDFVIFDMRNKFSKLSKSQIKKISDRKFGVGCDQLIIIKDSKSASCEMIIYNQDGSKAEACGNATRCISKFLGNKNNNILINGSVFETSNISESKISVNMGTILETPKKHKFKDIEGYEINIGNPHLVFFVEDYNFDISDIGRHFECHKKFPNRINVNFAKITSDKTIELKVWERGAGATLACGTGACATQYIANSFELTKSKVKVKQSGGVLDIEIKNHNIIMTGDAKKVFDGIIEL